MGEQTDNTLTYHVSASERAKPSPWQARVEGSRGEVKNKLRHWLLGLLSLADLLLSSNKSELISGFMSSLSLWGAPFVNVLVLRGVRKLLSVPIAAPKLHHLSGISFSASLV
jgi:hypothetical protein